MKLYDVPCNTIVRVLEFSEGPPGAPTVEKGEVVKFKHIDGMYSYCVNSGGELVHLKAWAEVEIIKLNEGATTQ